MLSSRNRRTGLLIALGAGLALGVAGTLLLAPSRVETELPSAPSMPLTMEAPTMQGSGESGASLAAVRRMTKALQDDNEKLRAWLEAARRTELEATLAWLRDLSPSRFRWLTAARLEHIVELDLSRLALDADDLAFLNHLPALAKLNLRGTGIGDEALAHVAGLEALASLDLTGTLVTDAGLKQLHGLAALEQLALDYTQVGDAGLAALGDMTSLRELTLDGTKITDAGLDHIRDLEIEGLGLGATQVGDAGLVHLENFALKELSLYRNTNITDVGMQQIGKQTDLRNLNVRGMKITEKGLAHLHDLKSLTDLNASLVMSDAAMVHLRDLTSLQRLGLYSNPKITDAGVAHLRNLRALESLMLQFTKITDAGLAHLDQLPALRHIDLRGTGVSAEAYDAFRAAHPDTRVMR